MAMKKKKGTCGEVKLYISRNRAAKLLQLNLQNFRRLCILKGIYPREPNSRKKAQGGSSDIKTLFLKRDITYLSHEPIIWKFREEKVFRRKFKTMMGKREATQAHLYRRNNRPTYKLDHIVLERYPTFDKALQDLDDPLSACFLYGTLPNDKGIDCTLVHTSRRLSMEFLNFVIESRALRHAFISIKGYFYRAHINGEKITWMIPHPFQPERTEEADIRIMRIFIEFYCTMLSFVNFKLYQSLNLYYPPKLHFTAQDKDTESKKDNLLNAMVSLNAPLKREFVETVEDDKEYDQKLFMNLQKNKKLKLAREEQEKVKNQIVLFNKVKFYLGRETNRESLVFVIRSAGGLVSWDAALGPGSTYTEDDKDIQYHIVDRPEIEKKYLSRYYVQPQWVYDSFNAALLVPVQNYFVGVALPAHLSPFEERFHAVYNPPEMDLLKELKGKVQIEGREKMEEYREDEEGEEEEEEEEVEEEEEEDEEEEEKEEEEDVEKGKKDRPELTAEERLLSKMRVRKGRMRPKNLAHEKFLSDAEDLKMAASLIHRKQKRMFKRILNRERKTQNWGRELKKKRKLYEAEMARRRVKGKREGNKDAGIKI